MVYRYAVWACLLLCLMGGGCRQKGDDPNAARVRIIDAVADSGRLRVAVSGKDAFGVVRYREGGRYTAVAPGKYLVSIAAQNRGNGKYVHLRKLNLVLKAKRRYTAIALGRTHGSPAAHAVLYEDDAPGPLPPGDQCRVRVLAADPEDAHVDVLVNSIVAFKDISFGERSDAITLAALPYEWAVVPAGSLRTRATRPARSN